MDEQVKHIFDMAKPVIIDMAASYSREPCWHDHHGYCQAHLLHPKEDCPYYICMNILTQMGEYHMLSDDLDNEKPTPEYLSIRQAKKKIYNIMNKHAALSNTPDDLFEELYNEIAYVVENQAHLTKGTI